MPGRGGAGNILQAQSQSRAQAEDLEAAHPPPSISAPSAPQPQPEYAHTGRGGAGNWFSPPSLSALGSFISTSAATPSSSPNPASTGPNASDASAHDDATAPPLAGSKPNVSTPWHPAGTQMPIARGGRGGAGNFVWGDEERERREREALEEVRRREEAVRASVERGVDGVGGLERPGRVVLGEGKGGRGW